MRTLFVFVVMILLMACTKELQSVHQVDLYDSAKDLLGEATFVENPEGVEIELKVEGLSPGYHAVHIHEHPTCEGDGFKEAGDHWNPNQKEHGLLNPEGSHLGDLTNVLADEKGEVHTTLLLKEASLLDKKLSLFEGGGTSIIIHEKEDDGMSQPAGDSGDRMICGVIAKEKDEK